MRISELRDRQVIDPTTARKRGRVVDVLVDPTSERLAGVLIAMAGEDSSEQIDASLIARIGGTAVMLRRTLEQTTPEAAGPTREACLDFASLDGLEVLDEGGNQVGHLSDAKIDPDSLAITAYALVDTSWRRWLGLQSEIGPREVVSWSRELMLVKPRSGLSAAAELQTPPHPDSLPEGEGDGVRGVGR